jgi:hypothetical protein
LTITIQTILLLLTIANSAMFWVSLNAPPMEEPDDQFGVLLVQILAFLNACVAVVALYKFTFLV